MPEATAAAFSIEYDAAQRLLVGHWLHGNGDDDLYPSYNLILAAARAHDNCRFWLLDMRKRTWHSDTFAEWFAGFLANKVVRQVGSPVFIAYVAAEEHRADIESVATQAMLRQAASAEFYPFFFNNAEAAREWLGYYQSHPSQLPPTPTA